MIYYIYSMRHQRDNVTFMAWHTVQDALKLTGRSRSQLYRDMSNGLVSYRSGKNGRREFETSELIRAYGELHTDGTQERHSKGHNKSNITDAENPQLNIIQKQLNDLQQTVTLMLEDKASREAERKQHAEEIERMRAEMSRLENELIQTKKSGFWSRLFRR